MLTRQTVNKAKKAGLDGRDTDFFYYVIMALFSLRFTMLHTLYYQLFFS